MAVDQRLPRVGDDDGVWGNLLTQYLTKEHFNDDTDNPDNGGHKTITIQPGNSGAGEAPLKFTAGSLLATKEAGAVEFNGNYFYASSGSPTATRRKIAMYEYGSEAKGDIYYQDASGFFTALPIGTQGQKLTVNGSGLPVWQSDSGTITGKTIDDTNSIAVKDANFLVENLASPTKQMEFDLSSITTGTKRTITVPDASLTIVGTDTTQVLSNKSFGTGMTWPTFDQDTVGNAATTTKLQTARSIQINLASTSSASFDGTANITPGVTGALAVANGGTGRNTLTSGTYIKGNGTAAVTMSATIPTSDLTGTVPVTKGGTGLATIPSGQYMKGNSTGNVITSASIPVSDIGTGNVTGSVNGTDTTLVLWTGTQAQYNAIGSKSSTTVYIIT